MKNRITHRNLPQLFLKARDSLMLHFRPILNHYGLTEQQWRVLRALDEHGQLEPREICTYCQILSASMAGVLARMEELGLVRRSPVAGDQRRVLIRLGAKGDRLIGRMAPLIELQYQRMEQAFGAVLFDELFAALEAFASMDSTLVAPVELPARVPVAAGRRVTAHDASAEALPARRASARQTRK